MVKKKRQRNSEKENTINGTRLRFICIISKVSNHISNQDLITQMKKVCYRQKLT